MEGHVQGPRQIAVQDVAGRPEERGHGEVAPARDEAYAADEDYCEGHGGGAVEPGEQLVPQNVLRVGTNGRSNLQFAPPGATGTPRRVQTPGSCTPSSRRRSCRVLCLRRTCANSSLVSRLLSLILIRAPDGAPTAREDDLMSARRTRGPRRTDGHLLGVATLRLLAFVWLLGKKFLLVCYTASCAARALGFGATQQLR